MTSSIRWAPRVPMEWLKRLYEQDALDITDEELAHKVGYRLYERCRDCVLVVNTIRGEFACLECGAICGATRERDDGEIVCPSCDWRCGRKEFRLSWRHKELNVDTTFVLQFIADWERARTYKQKILAIDGIIHRWHHETKLAERGAVGRPVGVNLIEGSRKQVIAFLDALTESENHERWAAHHENVKARVRGRGGPA